MPNERKAQLDHCDLKQPVRPALERAVYQRPLPRQRRRIGCPVRRYLVCLRRGLDLQILDTVTREND